MEQGPKQAAESSRAPEGLTRPSYRLVLRAEPNTDGVLALRGFLKLALRRFGLRCITVEEIK
jgi:hypothetical protein